MNTFLSWIASLFAKELIIALQNWLTKLLAVVKRQEQVDKDAAESVERLKKAKTGKEIDEASDDALSGF